MSKFAFVPGSTFHGDADQVQAELERLRRTGGLNAEAVVTAARPKRSVLHPHIFHIDRDAAADHYYKSRAGRLIVAVVKCSDHGEPTSIRANVRISNDTGGSTYISIDEEGARQAAMTRLRRDMEALRIQLRELEVYPGLADALEEALAA